jgi:Protein of unknown function (DUF3108).
MTSKRTAFLSGLMAAVLLVAAAGAHAAALAPFSARYQASYMGMQAEGTMTLARESGNRWKYSLNVRNQVADLSQVTVFEEHQGRLRPLSSSDRSLLLIKRKNVEGTYDWQRGVATWSGDVKPDRRGPVKLQPGDMDALLVNLAVARDVAAGRTPAYRMVEEGRARTLRYQVEGQEPVTVAGKTHQATRVVRRDEKRETIAWIVPGIPVPARILQREGGQDTVDLVLKSVD